MPLKSGKENVSKNIKELVNSGHKQEQAVAIAVSKAEDEEPLTGNRKVDLNGWPEIEGNPITKEGVFEYLGSQINKNLPPNQVFNVYRPAEELKDPDCIESFKLLPWTDDHYDILGSEEEGLADAGDAVIEGVIGEKVYFEDGFLKANIKAFTQKILNLIKNGKKQLSVGYTCKYTPLRGVFNGQAYEFVQRVIRGNHMSSVVEGRSGSTIAVLDSKGIKNEFVLVFDSMGYGMADEIMKEKEAEDQEVVSEKSDSDNMKQDVKHELTLEMVQKMITEALAGLAARKEEAVVEDEGSNVEVTAMDEANEKIKSAMDEVAKLKKDFDSYRKDAIKTITTEVSKRDDLAKRLSDHIGTFDCSMQTLDEVAAYGAKTVGIKCLAGHELAAVEGFLSGANTKGKAAFDSAQSKTAKSDDQIEKFLRG